MIEFEEAEGLHIPRRILVAAGLLLAAVIVLTASARLTGAGTVQNPRPDAAGAIALRDLRFTDRADGAVEVVNAVDGAPIAVLPPETHGFVRGSLRALVRERNRRGLGPEEPFRLAAWPDGRLTLEDLATGTVVDLRAFGPDNAAPFAALLTPAP
jgi:putative photosynthetic complex assembly protein